MLNDEKIKKIFLIKKIFKVQKLKFLHFEIINFILYF